MEALTDSGWVAFIHANISEMESTTESGPLASVTSPLDVRFPLSLDHTLLKQDATPSDIDKLCAEAITFGFKVIFLSTFIRPHSCLRYSLVVSTEFMSSKSLPD